MKLKINVADGKDVFFISDFHLFHKNVIKFDGRPFVTNGLPDVDLMHHTIMDNWNKTVKHNDVVIYLGDLCFSKWQWGKKIVDQLNGQIHFVLGNHDRASEIKQYGRFLSINDYLDLKIESDIDRTYEYAIMHYPIYSWNKQHAGVGHIHGHTHGNLHHGEPTKFDYYHHRKAIDVGCNLIDYTPISYKKINDIFEKVDDQIFLKHVHV